MESLRQRISRDPFAVDPLPKAHYFPSPPRNLTKTTRKTALSPDRSMQQLPEYEGAFDPDNEMFLQHANTYSSRTPASFLAEEKFDESWPSSERPSSASLTVINGSSPADVDQVCSQTLLDRFQDLKKTLEFSEVDPVDVSRKRDTRGKTANTKSKSQTPGASTLQRYIERFRHAKPQSREERKEKTSGSGDFWWLSSGHGPQSNGSSPDDRELGRRKKGVTSYSPSSTLSDISENPKPPFSPGDKETKRLQERADKLLEKSSSSLASSCPVVSTEGLGSPTSELSSFEEPSRRPVVMSRYERKPDIKMDVPRAQRVRPHPEDDILYQWRLKRKMDLARETSFFAKGSTKASSLAVDRPQQFERTQIDSKIEAFKLSLANKLKPGTVEFTPAPSGSTRATDTQTDGHVHNIVHDVSMPSHSDETSHIQSNPPIASPTLGRKVGSKADSLEPHLHLMCDLLPCPHQEAYQEKYSKKQSADESSCSEEQTQYKQYLEAERPDVDKTTTSVHEDDTQKENASMHEKTTQKEDASPRPNAENFIEKQIEKRPILKTTPPRKDKTSPKSDADTEKTDFVQHGTGNLTPARVNFKGQKENGVTKPLYSSSPKVRAGRPVSVDNAIGQVVNDRLFNMMSSSVISSVESLPSFTTPEPPSRQSPTPQTQPQHTAPQGQGEDKPQTEEDDYISDGEFEDDQLLQILRNQRSHFEQQLREIDEQLQHTGEIRVSVGVNSGGDTENEPTMYVTKAAVER
ncbi:hypothetical protein ScPMuIL_002451 [Solemya velum]